MVFPGEGDCMATGHERPKKKALHNFRFSSWGIQQNMRCMKVEPHGSSGGSGGEEGIEEFREKMMLDIRTVKESIFREHVLDYEEHTTNVRDEWEQPKNKEGETSVEAKRWNFRKRRGDCEAPFMELGFVEVEKVNRSIRSTFVSTLSRKEVEDDMMMMMNGQPPPRRPKKRSRTVQKKINVCRTLFFFFDSVFRILIFFFFWSIGYSCCIQLFILVKLLKISTRSGMRVRTERYHLSQSHYLIFDLFHIVSNQSYLFTNFVET